MRLHIFSPLVLILVLLMTLTRAEADVVVVSPIGTPAQNGQALLQAMAGILDASENNPYLLKIEPGVYDLGTNSLTMKEYVDIEGSGAFVTRITGAGSSAPDTGTVVGADFAELRLLTVENVGGGTHAIAILNESTSPRLRHIIVRALQDTQNAMFSYGVYNIGASPFIVDASIQARGGPATTNYGVYSRQGGGARIRDTNIAVGGTPAALSNYGVYNDSANSTMTNVSVVAAQAQRSWGVFNTAEGGSYRVTIEGSRIEAQNHALANDDEFTAHVVLSVLEADGDLVSDGGTVLRTGVYDEDSFSGLSAENDGTSSAGSFVVNTQGPSGGPFSLGTAAVVASVDGSGSGWAGRFHALNEDSRGVYISTPAGQEALLVSGGTKSAVVDTSAGARALYSEESTGVWFSDYGFGRLHNGRTLIRIDPVFAETVNLNEPYHVFLQAYGEATLFVSERTSTTFRIQVRDGDPNVDFSYRLVARRRGYEKTRLEHSPRVEHQRPGASKH